MNFEGYKKLREEPLKSAVYEDFFHSYKYTQIGNIDFVIAKHNAENGMLTFDNLEVNVGLKSLLWAEAKQGTSHDIYESFVQLILTIGKERTFEKYLPPVYIGAFDAEKFALIEYHEIQPIFYQNDFNWNVTPSDHKSKEFSQLYSKCKSLLEKTSMMFKYESQSDELKKIIRSNFKTTTEATEKIEVTKNNFVFVFQRWQKKVEPTISVDWEEERKSDIISADFFLADLLSENNSTLKDDLSVVLKQKEYFYNKVKKPHGKLGFDMVGFTDGQKSHKEFWNIYDRPPKEEYWTYIITRRDLLVPQDIRERKGTFFTPQIWVEKSRIYLEQVLGKNWQDEYYIWDCCAGTGNLLNELTNYRNVWASTIDKADVGVMIDRTHDKAEGKWAMFEDHIFQFDFLNDDFSKCPEGLQEILKDEEKRKHLVIYINPPYAEAGNKRQITGNGENKKSLSENKIAEKYALQLGKARNELYAQFFARIYFELKNCVLAEFSKTKLFQALNFSTFRKYFLAKLEKIFLVPANTFDNVKGEFPIGFFIWKTEDKRTEKIIESDVYIQEIIKGEKNAVNFGTKKLFFFDENDKDINKWISIYFDKDKNAKSCGSLMYDSSDFQAYDKIVVTNRAYQGHHHYPCFTKSNLIPFCVYFSVRLAVPQTWLNDRDQFLFPNDGWKTDFEFQADCLIFTLFHGQNRISCEQGTNCWIPFTEEQAGSTKSFKSHFMSDFIAGRIKTESSGELEFDEKKSEEESKRMEFSAEARAVYDSGLKLWRYYHSQRNANPNASFYDIRKYFQGEKNGKMNSGSDDERYTELISSLRTKIKLLAAKIKPKVYEYGFLK